MHASAEKSWGTLALIAATIALTTACGQSSAPTDGEIERVGSAIARGEAQISIPALSHRVIEDQGDFVLVDLRSTQDFEAFHIPGAVNLSAMEIVRPEKAREVAGGRQIILYSDSAVDASQTSALLQVAGFNALALAGGFQDWFDYTSNPAAEIAEVGEAVSDSDRQAFAQFFHGGPVTPEGYAPAVTPATGGAAAALGLAPPPAQNETASTGTSGAAAALGLAPPEEEEEEPAQAPRRLIIGEGC
ncbi:MAG: rhodanese-like domain-containing protein [Wenzhouxiangella sp.]|jgi:rhodanese-related sulfurtransferase|nr:rhodanese-like domain-containing protein [Wenzhouxiangella sp.]